MARARSGASAVGRSPSASVKPRRKCASIIPELPRAPSTAARAMVRAVSGSEASPSARRASATARRVKVKLVPVSPSGTGKTLIRLISSRPAATHSAAAKIERARRGPSTYAIATGRTVGSLRDDGDAKLSVDLGMQPDRHGVLPNCLDRVLHLDTSPIDGVALAGQRVGNVLGGNGAEKLAFFSGFAGERQADSAQCRCDPLSLGTLGLVTGCPNPSFSRDALLVPLSCLIRKALRQQVVPGVPWLNSDHLTSSSERLDILPQNQFDHSPSFR